MPPHPHPPPPPIRPWIPGKIITLYNLCLTPVPLSWHGKMGGGVCGLSGVVGGEGGWGQVGD
jgi:hypothetical protein